PGGRTWSLTLRAGRRGRTDLSRKFRLITLAAALVALAPVLGVRPERSLVRLPPWGRPVPEPSLARRSCDGAARRRTGLVNAGLRRCARPGSRSISGIPIRSFSSLLAGGAHPLVRPRLEGDHELPEHEPREVNQAQTESPRQQPREE